MIWLVDFIKGLLAMALIAFTTADLAPLFATLGF